MDPPCAHFLRNLLALCTTLLFSITATALRTPKLLGESWQTREDYPIPVLEAGGGVLIGSDGGRFLVVAGGYVTNTGLRTTAASHALPLQRSGGWTRLADMPMNLTHVAQAVVHDRIYGAGGFLGQAPGRTVADCFVFHLPSNTWSKLPSLPAPRAGGGLVYIAQINALLYASGTERGEGYHVGVDKGDCWMLYLRNLSLGWMRRTSISNPRNHMAAVTAGGRYYFLGGQHTNKESTENQATVQEYDFWHNRWIDRSSMPVPVGHIAASTVSFWNGIVVVGGISNGRVLSNRVHYYDIFADQWHFIGTFSRSVQSPVCGFAFQQLYCATGVGNPGTAKSVLSRELTLPVKV